MRIIIDAMGGDNAPMEIVRGAVDACREFGVDAALVGREDEVRACLAECGASEDEHISVVHAEDVISMHDDPSTAVHAKPDSSMSAALTMLRNGEGAACVSAGSTGALLAGATLKLKRIRGIRRACLSPVIPNGAGGALLIDCGANAECTSEFLLQFAYMGSFYARGMLGCENARVALLNIGAEDTKGTELQRETYALLRQAHEAGRINFVGNIEGGDVLFNKADVIVTDGFSGNILLKSLEGTSKFFLYQMKTMLASLDPASAAAVAKSLGSLKKHMDASETGGTPLLGISKPVIKAHGSSNARAIRSAIKQTIAYVENGVIDDITANLEYMKLK